ncbi:uncharacterized protein si:ch211-244b2.3 [Heptranchias perlo]|uniref:uncharacterized protein si:ch211-244b2.3 n=1 Tax=Heptranchias perlo TaxID=212740 RepID=UPI0035594E0A
MEFCSQSRALETGLNGKAYQWQVHTGNKWLDVAHDDIIEAQYSLPGAAGINLHTAEHGSIYLDFDEMEIVGSSFKLQRLTSPQSQRMEHYSWYFLGDHSWREYGSQDTGNKSASIKSSDIECQFQVAPQVSFQFQVGRSHYAIDFRAMIQTNVQTGKKRKVRRRSQFTSASQNVNSVPDAMGQMTITAPLASCTWQFKGDDDRWLDYRRQDELGTICSVSSQDIEQSYQQNPRGSQQFTAGLFTYTLDFSAMTQKNLLIGTQRAVRRLVNPSLSGASGAQDAMGQMTITAPLASCTWQFKGDDDRWLDYRRQDELGTICSVSSQDIEQSYQQNPRGSQQFTAGLFTYTLDFSAMTQKNLLIGTQRAVRRLVNPSLSGASGTTGNQTSWQFMDDDGLWKEYSQAGVRKSVSSQDIERTYQLCPWGTMQLTTGLFQYRLDFSAMTQTNLSSWKVRQIRRL